MGKRQNRYYQGPPSDHYDGERFFMPGRRMANGLRELIRWQRSGSRQPWPRELENAPHPAPPDKVVSGALHVTYFGQATALIQVAGLNILTDPFFSRRASPVQWAGPTRVRPPGLALDQLPRIHAVLVSHNHYDHMDLPSIRKLFDRHRPRFLAPLGNAAILARTRRQLDVTEGACAELASCLSSAASFWAADAFNRYSYVGAAYFCPRCGQNSASHTFFQTLASIKPALPLRHGDLPSGGTDGAWEAAGSGSGA